VIPGFEFAARYEPARQVGGDFYDVIHLDNERVGLVIGDVSDKGMPAALFMALTRSLILAEARREASPQRVLYNVNQLLCELGKANMFVTVFYGVVDIRRQSLVYARAGHDLPLLLQNGSIHALGGEGIVLGLLDQEHFFVSEENVALSSGDRLVLYTDGLTDVQNDNREIYAYERFQELVEHLRELAPHDFCETIFAHLDHYRNGAEQFDDMTLLIMRLQ
jgi:sigma-B regulation protein RsbU (phosphoserine phosphatase)